MNKEKILSVFFSILIADSIAQTIIPPGDVSGIWTLGGSPYEIQGEINIPNGLTLTIEPGVLVEFQGHYKFNVQGRLLAVGTQQDSIRFTANDTQIGWHGIRFNYTPAINDTSKIIYCTFKYGKANTGTYSGLDRCGGAIFIHTFEKVFVSNSSFEANLNDGDITSGTGGAVIYVHYGSAVITNSTFLNNTGTSDCGIFIKYSDVVISNNIFSNNSGPHGPVFCLWNNSIISGNFIFGNVTTRAGGGIFTMGSNAVITNNIIINNQCFGVEGEGGGIKCWMGDSSIIINNTIAYNNSTLGGGICCNQNSNPIFINNIIWGNIAAYGNQVNLMDNSSDADFFYCDIQGGKDGFGGNGAGVNYTGRYENNIDTDPVFFDTTSYDFHLSDNSPCIGTGIDSIEVRGTWYYAPSFDYDINPRPNPAGTMPDLGACENLLGSPVDVEQEVTHLTQFTLKQNFPNPFNPSTTIKYSVPQTSQVQIKVFDVLGNEIETIVNEEKPAGTYELTWNSVNLPSGVYFYQLKSGEFIQTKKMILLK